MRNRILYAATFIFVCAAMLLAYFSIRHKYDDIIKKKSYNDSIEIVQDNSTKWVIDTIYQEKNYYYTISHNLQYPKLGVKIEEAVKPYYSIKDTVTFKN